MKKYVLAGFIALTGAGTVVANDTWTGAYAGLSVGQTDANGISWGAQGGYDWTFGNKLVLGLVLDYTDANVDHVDSTSGTAIILSMPPQTYNIVTDQAYNVKSIYSLRGRLGYDGKRIMPYLTIGYTSADVEFSSVITSNGSIAGANGVSDDFNGIVWGAGLEFKFNNNWSGQLEYLDYASADAEYTLVTEGSSNFPGIGQYINQEIDIHTIRFNINYRF